MKKVILFGILCVCVSIPNVKAIEKCEDLSEEDLKFYESLNRPDVYDLSCSNGTPYTDEYLKEISEININSNEKKDSNPVKPFSLNYFVNKINVTPMAQETQEWCGPAAMQQTINAIKGSAKSQYYYGTLLGTHNTTGTDQRYFAGALNSELGISNYTYSWTGNLSAEEFYNKIKRSIDLGYPVIYHVRMEKLPAYNYNNYGGHFVTINGYSYQASFGEVDYNDYKILYVDPNNTASYPNAFGEHTIDLPIIKAAGSEGTITYAV